VELAVELPVAVDPGKPAAPDRSPASAGASRPSAGVLNPREAAENAAGCPAPAARLITPRGDATSGAGAPPADDGVPGLRSAPVRPGSDRRRHRSREPGPIRSHPPRTRRLPVGMVVLAPKSGVQRSAVKRSLVERLMVKPSALKPVAVERGLRVGLLREPAGQGWGGWTQEWGMGRRAAGWLLRLELPPSRRSAGAAIPTAPRPAG